MNGLTIVLPWAFVGALPVLGGILFGMMIGHILTLVLYVAAGLRLVPKEEVKT